MKKHTTDKKCKHKQPQPSIQELKKIEKAIKEGFEESEKWLNEQSESQFGYQGLLRGLKRNIWEYATKEFPRVHSDKFQELFKIIEDALTQVIDTAYNQGVKNGKLEEKLSSRLIR